MTQKIFANLKDKTQVILFDENSSDFNNIKDIFSFDIDSLNKLNFLENLNSKLRDGEIYYIQITQENENIFFSEIKLDTDSIDNNQITKDEYKSVDFIYLVNSSTNKIYFKKIYSINHIEKRKVLGFNGGPTYKEESNKINLSLNVDIVYNIKEKKIYFKKFGSVKNILKNVINLYRIATKDEIKSFFNNSKFNIDDSILEKTTDKFRKRITVLIDKEINFEDEELMTKYENYDKKYKNILIKKDGKYQIKNKLQLENFVELLEERFYNTPITKEKREVDNFRKI